MGRGWFGKSVLFEGRGRRSCKADGRENESVSSVYVRVTRDVQNSRLAKPFLGRTLHISGYDDMSFLIEQPTQGYCLEKTVQETGRHLPSTGQDAYVKDESGETDLSRSFTLFLLSQDLSHVAGFNMSSRPAWMPSPKSIPPLHSLGPIQPSCPTKWSS
jgi:hypothetical protein